MTVRARARVEAPQLAVWDAWINLPDWPAWAPGVRQVDVDWSGDVMPGGAARVHTPVGARDFIVTDVDAPRSWTWRGRLGLWSVTWEHRLAERDDSSTEAATIATFSGRGAGLGELLVGVALRLAMRRKLSALARLFNNRPTSGRTS